MSEAEHHEDILTQYFVYISEMSPNIHNFQNFSYMVYITDLK